MKEHYRQFRLAMQPKNLEPTQQALIDLSWQLYDREVQQSAQLPGQPLLYDYSFIVFPMAKAYEGFLKSYLLERQLISREVYSSRRLRIGRALNPDVPGHQRDEQWFFDDLVRDCGKPLAQQVWDTWLVCRNHLFHYFPDHVERINLAETKRHLDMLSTTIEALRLHL